MTKLRTSATSATAHHWFIDAQQHAADVIGTVIVRLSVVCLPVCHRFIVAKRCDIKPMLSITNRKSHVGFQTKIIDLEGS